MTPYIDFHCDTLMMFARDKNSDLFHNPERMIDLKRLKEASCRAQFFATFMPPIPGMQKRGITDEEYRSALYNGLMDSIKKHEDIITFCRTMKDYEEAKKASKIGAFLTFEDGRMVDGSFEKLDEYYDLGYRLITLTWNFINCFGYPNSDDPFVMQHGLTEFGLEAVPYMNDKGIIVDVSHLSDGGFWDVVKVNKKPFIASHSCARSLTPHNRNLTDDMLKALGEKGGFVGVNFAPEFVGETITCKTSSVQRICDHVEYMADKAGIEAVGIGSDFDGIGGDLEVGQPTDMEKLFHELSRRGWSDDKLEKFGTLNAERVLKDILK